MEETAARVPHAMTCVWFWAWAAVGATGSLGLVSLGPIALVPALAAAAALTRHAPARRSTLGVLAGAGLLALYVASCTARRTRDDLLAHRDGDRVRPAPQSDPVAGRRPGPGHRRCCGPAPPLISRSPGWGAVSAEGAGKVHSKGI